MKRYWALIVVGALLLAPGLAGAAFNHDDDGDVDLGDYVAFEACLTGPAVEYTDPDCDVFDENGDLHVDLFDFGGFQRAFGDAGPGIIYRVELAGNSLGEYPHFEYVKAFNEDATVEVAIDPTRYPEVVGQTCDIYIVDAKTGGGWASDPSLSDVTGSPQTQSFGGTTIQENTFTVANPFELDADAGIGLGVGYDVVLDCDQDGELSSGDYIDGLGNEAGLYAVHDTTAPGPLAVTEVIYSGGSWLGQDTYYPTNIGELGELPLVVVSHGNGHNYQWYDQIGYHMASYGYVVMSHENQTGPGIETASTTTLTNTDYIIGNQDSIEGGVLDGHIDSSRITWIGHSRGAEGIARAYDRLHDEGYTPAYFTIEDVQLLSSMLPVDFLKTSQSNPHGVNYHLWTASGDADVNGSASCDLCQTFHLHERATRYRMSTVVQGTGHGDFHDGSGGSVFSGPCHITPRSVVHDIQKGLFLPLIKHYIEGNVPATDFFWRQYEHFHPIGVDLSNPCIVVSHEYRNGSEDGNFFIDNYEEGDDLDVSSSGGAVTYTVENISEGRLDDNNSSFSWSSGDPFNGATQNSSSGQDNGRGVVFDWNDEDLYYEWEVIADERNFNNYIYLSFRGAQGTQHPYTLAEVDDLTFTVTLRDGDGTTSAINTGAYGGGFEQPYDRSGGWHNEMEVVRMRATDFLHNGSGLDLNNIVAVRLDCGPSWGSSEGRIVIDELYLTNDYPSFFVPLTIQLGSEIPEFIPSGEPTTIDVIILEGNDTLVPGSALIHYRYDGGAFQTALLEQVAGELYQGTLPAPGCDDMPEYYFSAEGAVTGLVSTPSDGPASFYSSTVGTVITYFEDDFETDMGWTVVDSPDLRTGSWDRGVPFASGEPETQGDPQEDYDGSSKCYVTGNTPNEDVDGGPTWLYSPVLDLTGTGDPLLRYARWFVNLEDDPGDFDFFDVELSDDGGDTWVVVETIGDDPPWMYREVRVLDYVSLTSEVQLRFTADDQGFSRTEAGVDAVSVFDVVCE